MAASTSALLWLFEGGVFGPMQRNTPENQEHQTHGNEAMHSSFYTMVVVHHSLA